MKKRKCLKMVVPQARNSEPRVAKKKSLGPRKVGKNGNRKLSQFNGGGV